MQITYKCNIIYIYVS